MPQKEIFAAIAIQIITCTSAIGLGTDCILCTNMITGECSTTGPTCCAPCYSATGGITTQCPSDCPNSLSFTQVSGTNYEAKCVNKTLGTGKECQYQCISNYFNYSSGGVIGMGGKPVCYKCPTANVSSCTRTGLTCKTGYYHRTSDHTCALCPSNATCTADNFNCAKGYYKASSTSTTCTRCRMIPPPSNTAQQAQPVPPQKPSAIFPPKSHFQIRSANGNLPAIVTTQTKKIPLLGDFFYSLKIFSGVFKLHRPMIKSTNAQMHTTTPGTISSQPTVPIISIATPWPDLPA